MLMSILMFFMIEYFKASCIHSSPYCTFSSDVLCGLLQCLGGAFQNVNRLAIDNMVFVNGEFCRYFSNLYKNKKGLQLKQSARNLSQID